MLFLFGCAPDPVLLPIITTPDLKPVFEDFVDFLDDERVQLSTAESPAPPSQGMGIAVNLDLDCGECFEMERVGDGYIVHGGGVLGAQYGVARVLENLGYRFYHPNEGHKPETLSSVDLDTTRQSPVIARRGLHLHTLHPIEALPAFWTDTDPTEARRVIDWMIKNGGNHLQWVGLEDIDDPSIRSEWAVRTAQLQEIAHQRGITVGLGIQLYGSSNLQLALDLIDVPGRDEAAQVEAKVKEATEGLEWDVLNLSFGEFSGQEPQTFIDSVNLAYQQMQKQAPGVQVPATIHVGNYPDLQVSYQGQSMIYYFLVQFCDPGIEPWIHSVMYYNLFEDAGGAYLHDEFDQHRAFLLDHLKAGQPVGYFPETAYWVAFDNSVPQWFPLYVYSRWTDLQNIGPMLQDHVVFSSGWEWGYWQNDAAALRMGWGRDADWTSIYLDFFAPLGRSGQEAADTAIAVAKVQHDALIGARLAPYISGHDIVMDIGDAQGIIAAPTRPKPGEVYLYDAEQKAAFQKTVVEPLVAYAEALEAISVPTIPEGEDRRVIAEVADGLLIDQLRARFAAQLWGGMAAETTDLSAAEATLEEAQLVVDRRHSDFHHAGPWTEQSWENPTIYDYGYLARAKDLCYWRRELAQAKVALGESLSVPGCAF